MLPSLLFSISCTRLGCTLCTNVGLPHILDLYVSESTVYRILKREGLIKTTEVVGFTAAREYRHKTKIPPELWATDCAYLKVMGWGWYYLVTVMDNFSQFILAWKLQLDMSTSGSRALDSEVSITSGAKMSHFCRRHTINGPKNRRRR